MQVQLKRPEHEKFITEQVKAGRYSSAEAAVEAAVEQMRLDEQDFRLTHDDIKVIQESEEQIDRGEYMDFDIFAAEMRKKYCDE